MQVREISEEKARELISAARQAVLAAENESEEEGLQEAEEAENKVPEDLPKTEELESELHIEASEAEPAAQTEVVADHDEPQLAAGAAEAEVSTPEHPVETEADSEPKE